MPDLDYNGIRSSQYICGCKSEQPDIRQQQAILTTIVLNKAGAMRVAVIFETQPMLAVIQVWSPKKGTSFVPDGHLYLGTGQPIQDEQHSKAGFHGRFRGGFGQF